MNIDAAMAALERLLDRYPEFESFWATLSIAEQLDALADMQLAIYEER